MKKAITLLCLLSTISLVGGLTSCGPQGPGSTSEADYVPTPGDKVHVEFWHTFGQGIEAAIKKKAKEFSKLVKEEEGIDVTIKTVYKGGYPDIKKNIEQGFGAGNVPTIAVAYPDHVAGYLRSEPHRGEYVTNFDDLINNEVFGLGKEAYLSDTYGADDFVPAFLEEGQQFTVEGTYTLPFLKSSEVMYFNTEAVYTAIKLQNPAFIGTAESFLKDITWDEFIKFNEFCVAHKSEILTSLDKPLYYDSDSNLFISKMFQNGIPYSGIDPETKKGVISFAEEGNLERAKELVRSFKDIYDKGILETKGTLKTYGSDSFVNQECLFSIGSSGGAGYNIPSSDAFEVGIVKVPYDNRPLYVTQGPCLTMLKNTSYSKAENQAKTLFGWKFIKYLMSPLSNVFVCDASKGYIPVKESAYETDEYQLFLEQGEDIAKTAKVLLEDINGSYLNTAVFPGSAELRTSVGGIVTQSLLLDKNSDIDKGIDGIFTRAIDDARVNI